MKSILSRLRFDIWYLRRPPWDTGVSPPELIDYIQRHPPGQAIDLGCGTGTNVLTLAQAGWQVVGVDFSWRAIRKAQSRLRSCGCVADLRVGDVTGLKGFDRQFDLVLDIGCFHQLLPPGREKYTQNLNALLAPGGTYLLYAHCKGSDPKKTHGIYQEDLERFATFLRLYHREDGRDSTRGPSVWLWYQKDPQ